ncbi:MAG: glycosyltransferase family 4 protein [Thermoanaerobaculia bacterium]|nr:glycosyltransferase family 4 protein [Thermoanaerobaculia bacterium]
MHLTFVFPRLKTFSGAENLLLQLSRYAVEQGHEVVVVTRGVDSACVGLFHPRVQVRVPSRPFRWLTGVHLIDSFFDTAFAPALTSRLPRQTDVLCFFCPPVLPAMAFAYRRAHAPVAYYCLQPPRFAYDLQEETIEAHGLLGRLVPILAPLYRHMDRRLAPRCDRLFAISKDYAKWCKELYGLADVALVPPGVDEYDASQCDPRALRKELGIGESTPLVTTINKLIPRKNVDVFLHAMVHVIDRVPDAHGVVVGDGPSRPSLLRLRDSLGLADRVHFTGFLPNYSAVMSFYAASDVHVFLEKNVPFGLTVLEAGWCSCPVVAVRGGGTGDTVVEGQTGLLVDADPLDSRKVAEQIESLLLDRGLRNRMGQLGRQNATRFSHERASERFLRALASTAEDRRRVDSERKA